MPRTLNTRAASFALRSLFLAEPTRPGYPAASVAWRQLASEWCTHLGCEFASDESPCRKHQQAMLVGVAKLIANGEVFAEMSSRGVVFVRLSPVGVLEPESWSVPPAWFGDRPDLVEWARNDAIRRKWEARV